LVNGVYLSFRTCPQTPRKNLPMDPRPGCGEHQATVGKIPRKKREPSESARSLEENHAHPLLFVTDHQWEKEKKGRKRESPLWRRRKEGAKMKKDVCKGGKCGRGKLCSPWNRGQGMELLRGRFF